MSWDRMSKHKTRGGLGFRNFRDFNIAMLGKQGWRFIVYPNSLASTVYKAKYFPETDFMNSSLGHNPSFIWRSIFEAKQVLKEGLRWRVSNGENINILGQPWLEDAQSPYITSTTQGLEDKKVKSLFCTDRKEWDGDIIRDIFNIRDQEHILKTQLYETNNEDVLFWNLEDSGLYFVKSAYRKLQMQKKATSSTDNEDIWTLLWRVKAPPKTLNMVWRALTGCLPTKSQLISKHVHLTAVCPVCNVGEETVYHCLVSCPVVRQCWVILLPGRDWVEDGYFLAWLKSWLKT